MRAARRGRRTRQTWVPWSLSAAVVRSPDSCTTSAVWRSTRSGSWSVSTGSAVLNE